MIAWDWIGIVCDMKEPFDYEEYVFRSKLKPRAEPLDLSVYAQSVGLLMMAFQRYPRLGPNAAHLKLMEELGMHKPKVRRESKGGCNGCNS